jgi:hypothetical protein
VKNLSDGHKSGITCAAVALRSLGGREVLGLVILTPIQFLVDSHAWLHAELTEGGIEWIESLFPSFRIHLSECLAGIRTSIGTYENREPGSRCPLISGGRLANVRRDHRVSKQTPEAPQQRCRNSGIGLGLCIRNRDSKHLSAAKGAQWLTSLAAKVADNPARSFGIILRQDWSCGSHVGGSTLLALSRR